MRKLVHFLLVSCFGLVAACGELAGPASPGGPPNTQPERGKTAWDTLDCPEGDQLAIVESDLGPDVPGGPRDARAALQGDLNREGIRLRAEDFRELAETPTAAQLVYEEDGKRLVTVFAEQSGDSWYVTEFAACNGFVQARREPPGSP